MCTAHGKMLKDWLKRNDIWELFVTFAVEMGVENKKDYNPNSANTRVSASFTDLIQRKAGSPANGGGTWIHPLLALQLAQWVARKFADRVIIYLATLIRGFFSLKLLLQKRT